MTLERKLSREQIAERAAQELPDGAYVNLGWGIPNLIAAYVPESAGVIFHSENGILGMGPRARPGEEDYDLVDAMKAPVTILPGGAYFSQVDAHMMTRGGHLDVAVLGGLQVSERGDLANWKVPGGEIFRRDRRRDGYRRGFAALDHYHGARHEKWRAQNCEDLHLSAYRAAMRDDDRHGSWQ